MEIFTFARCLECCYHSDGINDVCVKFCDRIQQYFHLFCVPFYVPGSNWSVCSITDIVYKQSQFDVSRGYYGRVSTWLIYIYV